MNANKTDMRIAKGYHLALALITLLIAVLPKMVAIGFAVMFAISIIGLLKKQFAFRVNVVIAAFMTFYLFFLIGACFTNDFPNAMKVLEYRLSFIIIPILFLFRPKFKIDLAYPILGLALGIVCISIVGFTKAFGVFQLSHNALTSFTSSNICIDHPTYYAAFMTVALAGVWFLYKKNFPGFTLLKVIPFLLFAVVMILLSYSMSAILFLFAVAAFLLFKWIYIKLNKIAAVAMLVIAPFGIFFVITNTPALKNEFNNSSVALQEYTTNPVEFIHGEGEVPSGDKVRLIMWTVTAKECLKHPLGVGTGNVDENLSQALLQVNHIEMSTKTQNNEIRYNPHNQFLQTALELGFLGLTIFLFILVKSAQWGIRSRNGLLVLVVSCLSFNCLFESMLQRQTGIVFFTFWIVLLTMDLGQTNFLKEQANTTES
jgi:O-antigen ligase